MMRTSNGRKRYFEITLALCCYMLGNLLSFYPEALGQAPSPPDDATTEVVMKSPTELAAEVEKQRLARMRLVFKTGVNGVFRQHPSGNIFQKIFVQTVIEPNGFVWEITAAVDVGYDLNGRPFITEFHDSGRWYRVEYGRSAVNPGTAAVVDAETGVMTAAQARLAQQQGDAAVAEFQRVQAAREAARLRRQEILAMQIRNGADTARNVRAAEAAEADFQARVASGEIRPVKAPGLADPLSPAPPTCPVSKNNITRMWTHAEILARRAAIATNGFSVVALSEYPIDIVRDLGLESNVIRVPLDPITLDVISEEVARNTAVGRPLLIAGEGSLGREAYVRIGLERLFPIPPRAINIENLTRTEMLIKWPNLAKDLIDDIPGMVGTAPKVTRIPLGNPGATRVRASGCGGRSGFVRDLGLACIVAIATSPEDPRIRVEGEVLMFDTRNVKDLVDAGVLKGKAQLDAAVTVAVLQPALFIVLGAITAGIGPFLATPWIHPEFHFPTPESVRRLDAVIEEMLRRLRVQEDIREKRESLIARDPVTGEIIYQRDPVTGTIVYKRDADGKLILDANGQPIPIPQGVIITGDSCRTGEFKDVVDIVLEDSDVLSVVQRETGEINSESAKLLKSILCSSKNYQFFFDLVERAEFSAKKAMKIRAALQNAYATFPQEDNITWGEFLVRAYDYIWSFVCQKSATKCRAPVLTPRSPLPDHAYTNEEILNIATFLVLNYIVKTSGYKCKFSEAVEGVIRAVIGSSLKRELRPELLIPLIDDMKAELKACLCSLNPEQRFQFGVDFFKTALDFKHGIIVDVINELRYLEINIELGSAQEKEIIDTLIGLFAELNATSCASLCPITEVSSF